MRVNEPVKLIRQHERGVTVTTTTGLVAEAKRVIVAAPGTLDTFIRFDPILPPDRAQLQQRVPQGSVWKIWLVYDRAFWRERGLTGESISIFPGDFIPNARDGGGPAGQLTPGLMICFVVGDSARAFNAMTRGQRRAKVISELVHRFGAQAAELSPTIRFPAVPPQNPTPDNYFEFNWSIEEFARGDFAAVPGPRRLYRRRLRLRHPRAVRADPLGRRRHVHRAALQLVQLRRPVRQARRRGGARSRLKSPARRRSRRAGRGAPRRRSSAPVGRRARARSTRRLRARARRATLVSQHGNRLDREQTAARQADDWRGADRRSRGEITGIELVQLGNAVAAPTKHVVFTT